MLLGTLLILFWLCDKGVAGYLDELRLFKDVIDPVDKRVRPTFNDSEPVLVHLKFTPIYLKGLNEPCQIMEMFAWISVHWQYPQARWNRKKYGGISRITLDADTLWSPDIGIINSADHLYGDLFDTSKYRMVIEHDGLATIYYSGTVKTYCILDVTYFPFDEQVCNVEFDSWSLPMEFVKLNETSFVRMTELRPNGIWQVLDAWRVIYNQNYSGFTYGPISFVFRLRRKPVYFLTYIAFPLILLFMLEILVFCVPPENGEKVSLAITLMLSLTVFQVGIRNSMPATSDFFPYMFIYLSYITLLSALTLVQAVVVVRIHHRDPDRPVPPCVVNAVRTCSPNLLCLPKPVEGPQKKERLQEASPNKTAQKLDSTKDDSNGDKKEINIWIQFARIIDRISAILFFFVAFIITVGLFLACARSSGKRDKPIGGYGYFTASAPESPSL